MFIIHRQYPKKDFLQIKNENWHNMIKECKDYYALALYLYVVSIADNFKLVVSPAAIENAIGMVRRTYYKKVCLIGRAWCQKSCYFWNQRGYMQTEEQYIS